MGGNFWIDKHICGLDYGDGVKFISEPLSWIQPFVGQLYLNKIVFKNPQIKMYHFQR
jgi:hypothetical protein